MRLHRRHTAPFPTVPLPREGLRRRVQRDVRDHPGQPQAQLQDAAAGARAVRPLGEGQGGVPAQARAGSGLQDRLRPAPQAARAVAALRIGVRLDGVVEMDGMYVGGHVRPKNEKAKRVDRRIAENRTGKRMAVMVLRERAGDNMTLAVAVPGETGDVAWHLTRNHVARTALLRADQHPAYDELGGLTRSPARTTTRHLWWKRISAPTKPRASSPACGAARTACGRPGVAGGQTPDRLQAARGGGAQGRAGPPDQPGHVRLLAAPQEVSGGPGGLEPAAGHAHPNRLTAGQMLHSVPQRAVVATTMDLHAPDGAAYP